MPPPKIHQSPPRQVNGGALSCRSPDLFQRITARRPGRKRASFSALTASPTSPTHQEPNDKVLALFPQTLLPPPMLRTAPTTPAPARPIPGRIAAVLNVLAALIAHARHFAATATTRVAAQEFATAAAVFGTDHLPTILHRMQRGLHRALALHEYLLARAARGSNLRFAWPPCVDLLPHHRPPARRHPARAPRPPATASRPRASGLRRSGARPACPRRKNSRRRCAAVPSAAPSPNICMDLGIAPGLCAGEFWNQVEKTMRRYGGSLRRLCQVRARREEAFQRERDKSPDTWHIDWRDLRPSTVRRALGCLIGETPPDGLGPPVLVPG